MTIIMLPLFLKSSRRKPSGLVLRQRGGFTLTEIIIALAVLGTMSSGCYIGFNAITNYAVSSRLYSEAVTAAQNQVDLILSKGPFDMTAAYVSGTFAPALNKIPIELMTTAELDALATSGVNFPTQAPTVRPATSDPYYPYYPYYRTSAGTGIKKRAFIYQDPVTGAVVVTGELTSSITDTGMTMNFINPTPTKLNTRKATVTVTYDFKSRPYEVAMDTLRTADQ